MNKYLTVAARIVVVGVASSALAVTASVPASANDYFYKVDEPIPANVADVLLTTGDRVIRTDPTTGEWVSIEVITTTPWERAQATGEAEKDARIAEERAAMLAGNGPMYEPEVNYYRAHRRKDKGTFRAPTVTLIGCVNNADGGTTYNWRLTGGAYRSMYFKDNGVPRGNGKVYRNKTRTYTTQTGEFTLAFTRTKAKFRRSNLSPIREFWTITYTANLLGSESCL